MNALPVESWPLRCGRAEGDWTARAARLASITTAMRPSWHRRISAVAHRCTPVLCWRCLGEHGVHLASCPRALTSLATGNTALQLGNAVVRAEQRLRARRGMLALMAELREVAS